MKSLFDSTISAPDKNYLALRDEPIHSRLRAYCEELWEKFSPFADSSFPDKFACQLHVRFFEMYLGNQILELGFSLLPRNTKMGPDLHFMFGNMHVWIEATAPDEGTGEDAVPDIFSYPSIEPFPDDKIILRFTNAISEKNKRLAEYVKKEIVDLDDAYIIAINGGSIGMEKYDAAPIPAIVKAVYPVGEHTVTIDTQKLVKVNEHYKYRNEVIKKNQSPVSTRVFLDPNYSGISGVLYSDAALWDLPKQTGSEFLYIHNYRAFTPMNKGWMKIGKEWWWEGDRLVVKMN